VTELRLVEPEAGGDPFSEGAETHESPFSAGTPLPRRLPRGRHGIPAGLVSEHQRLRLLVAMAEALGAHGYGNVTTTHVSELANVSTSTFYKHFGNLWDCLLAAYVMAADRLCTEIEAACAASGEGAGGPPDGETDPLKAGIAAALAFVAADPTAGRLLSAQAPREASALCAARRLLVSRLAAMLRRSRREGEEALQPPGLDERLIDATLTFLHNRLASADVERLPDLAPELAAILERPRRAETAATAR
jgi:AcrR family transcriptional regulator